MTMPPAIFSVGYHELTPPKLVELVKALDCVLIDCRSYPSGRVKKGFSKSALAAALGERYEWRGDELGGKGRKVTREGLDRLAADGRRLMLLCAEEAPGECHRHHTIAVPLIGRGIVVRHIYRDEVIAAPELQRAIDQDDEYEYEDLAEVIGGVADAHDD
jgi:uncharacterized protein (DUF488 family)